MELGFGSTEPYTVGVEEEFQLVDPVTRGLTPAVDEGVAAGGGARLITSELSQSCIEMLSPVFGTVADLARELPRLRGEVRDLARSRGAEIVGAGTHPFSEPTEQPITGGDHHRRVEEEMGWVARTQAIYGLHIHVAVPDGDTAILAVNALAPHVPLLVALSANSPFWRGSDTRLASTRIKLFEMFPRSGLPPAFRNWEDFENYIEALVAAGSIPDYSWCWWDARPHQKFGTVELRAPDVQADSSYTAALAALVQCLVARAGMDADFYDFVAGREIPARSMARRLVEELRPVARDLGCEEELGGVLEIVELGTGAELQRAALGRSGSLEGVIDYLIEGTAPG